MEQVSDKENTSRSPDKLCPENNPIRDKILEGLELTHKRLLQFKKEKNSDLVISKDGEIVHIPAKNL